jgi:hypothetical protein
MSDILLLETSLEGHLVHGNVRRTQLDLIQSFVSSLSSTSKVLHERFETVGALQNVLAKCAEQNSWERARTTPGGDRVQPANVRFVHINAHGDFDGLALRVEEGGHYASPREISEAFSPLKKANVRAIVLSACQSGSNKELAQAILKSSGAEAVIGYPRTVSDDICAMAEQMLYFQLLRKERLPPVWKAVRRVNDALVLLGVKSDHLLSCWILNEKGEPEAYPWWTEAEDIPVTDRKHRSFLLALKECFPERGSVGQENLQLARQIVKKLF